MDFFKHVQSGSNVASVITSSEIITIRKDLPSTLEAALSLMPTRLDYVLAEGFKQSEYPKIIVLDSGSQGQIKVRGETVAVVLDQKLIIKGGKDGKVEQFRDDSVVDIIQSYFDTSRMAKTSKRRPAPE
jgi:molybdopterin-guanine dinucleotide biosynthesis protein MobB